ncbi:MAG: fimbrillin family protein [Bacteroidales bacterium]|nr:fimbrillin family protein [Bacteroidales bacterium]
MKWTCIIITLFLVACTKDNLPVTFSSPIEFGISDGSSKGQAPLVSLAELARRDFSVSAWCSPEGETFGDASVKYFENHRFGYITDDPDHAAFTDGWRGVVAHAATTGAATADPVYYPLEGTLSYFCYAPYRSDATLYPAPDPETRDIILSDPVTDGEVLARLPGYMPGSPVFRYTPAASAVDQADFLVAPPLLDRSRDDDGRLALDFSRHRLTQLKFAFNYSGELRHPEFICVTDIEVRQVVGSAYLYFAETGARVPDCRWSTERSSDDPIAGTPLPRVTYRLDEKDGTLLSGVGAEVPARNAENDNHLPVCTDAGVLYLLPQTLSDDVMLQVSYVICEQHGVPLSAEVVTVPLKTATMGAWPAGKQVRYLLTLNVPNHQVSGISPRLYDWEDAGNTHTPEQLLPHDS